MKQFTTKEKEKIQLKARKTYNSIKEKFLRVRNHGRLRAFSVKFIEFREFHRAEFSQPRSQNLITLNE